MRLYRSDDMTALVQWAGTQEDAARLWGRGCWELVDVPTDKPGLLAWLNSWGDALNRLPAPDLTPIEPAELAPELKPAPAPSYAAGSLAIDEAWQALPLARKLHLAALALEEAREGLK